VSYLSSRAFLQEGTGLLLVLKVFVRTLRELWAES